MQRSRRVKPLSTDRIETALEAEVTRYLTSIRQAIARQVLPGLPALMAAHEAPRFDEAEGVARIAGLRLEYLEIDHATVQRQLELFGAQILELSGQSLRRMIEAEVPDDKKPRLKRLGLETLAPWMIRRVQEWAALNASLIVSLPDDMIRQVDARVWMAIRDGKRPETLAGELETWLGAPPAQVQLIARDQVAKLQSDIIAGRQEELGIESYWWETANDRRVVGRPGGLYPKGSALHQNHWERRGRLFVANEGPPLVELVDGRRVEHSDWTDGHPGEGIQCRCYRRPNVAGLLRRL